MIDEYDVPLDKAFQYGYYDEMVVFDQKYLRQCIEDKSDLISLFWTGCLRISKESIFTGLKNLKVLTLTDVRFDEYLASQNAEVRDMLAYV